jgi:pimeloyl-ACP methyl ester carboxylesterase
MPVLSHQTIGEGPRSVVLLHGFLGSRRNLATLAERLREHDPSLALVALDLTGHGESPPLPEGADLGTLARDVLETADALRLPRPLTIVGHSLGGRVALRARLHDARAVSSPVLLDISPSPITGDHDVRRILEALLRAPDEAPARADFRAHFRRFGFPEPMVDWLLLNLARAGDDPDHGRFSLAPPVAAYRWRIDRRALAALHRRVVTEDLWLAVEGERASHAQLIAGGSESYVSAGDARRLVAAGCRVDVIEGASHWLHVERPDEVAARIVEHLAAVDAVDEPKRTPGEPPHSPEGDAPRCPTHSSACDRGSLRRSITAPI